MKIRVMALVCLGLLAFGCGKEGVPGEVRDVAAAPSASPTASSAPKATPAPAGTTAPVATPARVPAAPTAAPQAAGTGTLAEGLLDAAEVGPGWTAEEGSESDAPEFEPCGIKEDPRYVPPSSASADFSKDTAIVTQTNDGFATDEISKGAFAEAKRVIKECPEWTWSDEDGEYEFTATPTSFPALGDESAAYAITITVRGEADGQRYEAEGEGFIVGVRMGPNHVSVFHMVLGVFGPAEADKAETERITRAAVTKFDATV